MLQSQVKDQTLLTAHLRYNRRNDDP